MSTQEDDYRPIMMNALMRRPSSSCMSPACRRAIEPNLHCYSPLCRASHSLWHRRCIRQLLARIQICCALRVTTSSPFISFVPRALHEYLRDLTNSEIQEEVPFGTAVLGAVLFADASGFTALTERLAQSVSYTLSLMNAFYVCLDEYLIELLFSP